LRVAKIIALGTISHALRASAAPCAGAGDETLLFEEPEVVFAAGDGVGDAHPVSAVRITMAAATATGVVREVLDMRLLNLAVGRRKH
jgi:hypothetical protein